MAEDNSGVDSVLSSIGGLGKQNEAIMQNTETLIDGQGVIITQNEVNRQGIVQVTDNQLDMTIKLGKIFTGVGAVGASVGGLYTYIDDTIQNLFMVQIAIAVFVILAIIGFGLWFKYQMDKDKVQRELERKRQVAIYKEIQKLKKLQNG